MKKRVVLGILGFSAAFCCISLGYAAWTITGSMTGEASGNFQAYDATDNGGITVQLCESNGEALNNTSIIFGKPASTTGITNPWLTFSESGMATENLDAYVKVTYEKTGDYPDDGVTFDVAHSFVNADNSPSTQTVIDAPTITMTSTETGVTFANNAIKFTGNGFAIIKISYAWKTINANPYTHYNGQTMTPALRAEAYNYIHELYEVVGSGDKLKFVVTISKPEQ